MSTVIKAADSAHGVRSVAFNFDDLASEAEAYLRKVRAQAERIVAQAAKDAVALRKVAEVEGRRAGEQAIETLVDQKIARQLETVLPALRGAVSDIERSKQGWLANWEGHAIHLAAAMARRICRREVARQPEITLDLVREALELAGANSRIRILLHPDDQAALGGQLSAVVDEFARLGPSEIVADPQLDRGGCRVETDYGVIDQQFEAQLARIEEELTEI
ncbi:MAG TPA: FliH/SctL family protein [Pirellulales bacterium]|jgi:flagellar biosynthesis/type III secretory pathway protein FliH|nr:FliH/SctL family protein [Pirellulales bacterium]